MDDVAKQNMERWEALAAANVRFSRPILDFDEASASEFLDPHKVMPNPRGKDVLCLASGGGQQSAAFGLLGANVTVLDFSKTQLERDKQAADHYGLDIRLCQGDMRDLSCFPKEAFDIVYHAHSLNFIPNPSKVFDEVVRVLRCGGLYRLSYTNPFIHSMMGTKWHGSGYAVSQPYADGDEMMYKDPYWDIGDGKGNRNRVQGPREWRHGLSSIVNGLIDRGFVLLGMWEEQNGNPDAEPGSWPHFVAFFPPWLVLWFSWRSHFQAKETMSK